MRTLARIGRKIVRSGRRLCKDCCGDQYIRYEACPPPLDGCVPFDPDDPVIYVVPGTQCPDGTVIPTGAFGGDDVIRYNGICYSQSFAVPVDQADPDIPIVSEVSDCYRICQGSNPDIPSCYEDVPDVFTRYTACDPTGTPSLTLCTNALPACGVYYVPELDNCYVINAGNGTPTQSDGLGVVDLSNATRYETCCECVNNTTANGDDDCGRFTSSVFPCGLSPATRTTCCQPGNAPAGSITATIVESYSDRTYTELRFEWDFVIPPTAQACAGTQVGRWRTISEDIESWTTTSSWSWDGSAWVLDGYSTSGSITNQNGNIYQDGCTECNGSPGLCSSSLPITDRPPRFDPGSGAQQFGSLVLASAGAPAQLTVCLSEGRATGSTTDIGTPCTDDTSTIGSASLDYSCRSGAYERLVQTTSFQEPDDNDNPDFLAYWRGDCSSAFSEVEQSSSATISFGGIDDCLGECGSGPAPITSDGFF
ncbi:MAG: hypothetical protein AAGB48_01860 [Planctomycetota bacterium]